MTEDWPAFRAVAGVRVLARLVGSFYRPAREISGVISVATGGVMSILSRRVKYGNF